MTKHPIVISALYLPASVGLLRQSVLLQSLPERLLSLALTLFCIELARMAVVDLDNAAAIASNQITAAQGDTEEDTEEDTEGNTPENADKNADEKALSKFRAVVNSTVVLELIGFYGSLGFVASGAAVVIFSQLWFNLRVNVQLWPGLNPAVTPFELQQRIPVLVANILALLLVSLWFISSWQLWLASGLLILITCFLLVKYCLPSAQPKHPSA